MKKTKKNEINNLNKYWMLIVVVLLFIFSIVQAVQIDNLKDEVESAIMVGFSTGSSQNNQQPAKQTPAMVGGC